MFRIPNNIFSVERLIFLRLGCSVSLKEMLINSLCGMKCKAHGAQKPRHVQKYVEVTSTAQRSNSPAQRINQRFLKRQTSILCVSVTQSLWFSETAKKEAC